MIKNKKRRDNYKKLSSKTLLKVNIISPAGITIIISFYIFILSFNGNKG